MSRIEADITLELEPGELKVGCSDFALFRTGAVYPIRDLAKGGREGAPSPWGFQGSQWLRGLFSVY